ncbi:MAG: hypothetical protein J7M20_09630 [Deltaproteobacteria bacterium]|nr:hypothetical protein [Deltaproteobacteria bacterium]
MNENIVKWALGRVRHNFGPQDIIYSSGLTDYLDNRLFVKLIDRCYEQLRDEGVLIIGNFGPNNPNRQFMDHMLHWRLMHRDVRELKAIFKQTAFGDKKVTSFYKFGSSEINRVAENLGLVSAAHGEKDNSGTQYEIIAATFPSDSFLVLKAIVTLTV